MVPDTSMPNLTDSKLGSRVELAAGDMGGALHRSPRPLLMQVRR